MLSSFSVSFHSPLPYYMSPVSTNHLYFVLIKNFNKTGNGTVTLLLQLSWEKYVIISLIMMLQFFHKAKKLFLTALNIASLLHKKHSYAPFSFIHVCSHYYIISVSETGTTLWLGSIFVISVQIGLTEVRLFLNLIGELENETNYKCNGVLQSYENSCTKSQ